MSDFDQLFAAIEAQNEGNLHIAAIEISSGQTWMRRPSEKVSTASTIKLPVLMHTAMCVEEGKFKWEKDIMLHSGDVVPGMGVLRHMKTPRCLTLYDVCYLMTAISDNTATNLVIDVVGLPKVNQRIDSFGLANTRLHRKVFHPDTDESREFGLGVSTAFDMMRMMQIIYAPESIPAAEASKIQSPGTIALQDIRKMLELQQDLVGVARVLPPDWTYAGKTGRITSTRAEAAFITAPDGRQWAIGIFSFGHTKPDWSIQHEGLLAIGEATKIITGL